MFSNDILSHLEHPDSQARETGLRTILETREYDFLGDVLQLLQQDNDPEIRAKAACTLNVLHHPASVPALIDALYDPNLTVRSCATFALIRYGQRVVRAVIPVLLDHRHPDARDMAYIILQSIDSEEARYVLRRYGYEA